MSRKQQNMKSDVRSIEWYSQGQSQTVLIGDQEIHVRFVGRKGRRGRIAITAPAGATIVKQSVRPPMAAQSTPGRKGDAHAGQR